jgi:hypothetical protein
MDFHIRTCYWKTPLTMRIAEIDGAINMIETAKIAQSEAGEEG